MCAEVAGFGEWIFVLLGAGGDVVKREISSLFDLSGRTAVVTGAGRGIGKEIALLLAKAGANVALIARSLKELEQVADEIESIGSKALPLSFDLTRTAGIPEVFDNVQAHFGRLDILVNNAGINIPKPALEVTEEDWDKVMDINLKSVFFCCQAAAKHMISGGRGKIVNISSQMAHVGYFNRSVYCASKGGLLQLTRALAIEWAAHPIHVNCIAPTFIETSLTRPMFQDERFYAEVLSRIPLGRIADPDDLYGAVLYLCSDASNMVTGQSLIVDGGWTVW